MGEEKDAKNHCLVEPLAVGFREDVNLSEDNRSKFREDYCG
jgi:hypothetical protein